MTHEEALKRAREIVEDLKICEEQLKEITQYWKASVCRDAISAIEETEYNIKLMSERDKYKRACLQMINDMDFIMDECRHHPCEFKLRHALIEFKKAISRMTPINIQGDEG